VAKTKSEAEREANEIVENWVGAALLTGWAPGSAVFLTGADMIMTRQVADAFGVGVFNEKALANALGTAVGSTLVNTIIAELSGLIPGAGPVMKSGMMGAKAKLIGEATIEYFKDLSPLAS
jgi:hypothetical protein